jgi:hypothetical protein
MTRWILCIGFFLGLLVGCDTEGDTCEVGDDCQDGQICAFIAACAPGSDCPGVCAVVCDTDADCEEQQVCSRTSSEAKVCSVSRIPE